MKVKIIMLYIDANLVGVMGLPTKLHQVKL